MGVMNITPDSFSDGGTLYANAAVDLGKVRATAQRMIAGGASILDVGGESTRPGATPVSVEVELQRVIPVVAMLGELGTIVSVDTRHAEVARCAIDAGADVINDVSAGADPKMIQVIAETSVGYGLMHMQGVPETMQQAPAYQAVVAEVHAYLASRVHACKLAGIAAERLWVDPGFGFGKTQQHNLSLLADLERVRVGQLPLLVGLSRKRLLGEITGRETSERVFASVAAAVLAVERGADLVRVHDVEATADALKVLAAMRAVALASAAP
ncbi:MAG: dihydropteroate synthase [Gammaproteobacteria bacterium]|jgi:dihydropteroate synthase|nr:dihydropteroate synthase [Gammaproteobacteria bacterium]